MCGIVGLISKAGTLPYSAIALFTNMVRMDSVRGEDSTGVFGICSDGSVDMVKGDADGYHFTTTKPYWDFARRIDKNYKVVIGHNRKATSGKVVAANAHPFQHQHIMMVHNGNVKNAAGIAEVEVDSEAIAHALAQHDPVVALGKIDGAYAIAWYDGSDKTISLARNKERPLYLLEYAAFWVISSEPGLPLWLNGREGRKNEKMLEVPTERIWTFNLDGLGKGHYEIPYEEFKHWVKPKEEKPSYKSYEHRAAFSSNDNKVHNLSPTKKPPYKLKDRIVFSLEDEKVDNGAQVLLGHPMENGSKDESIFVRVALNPADNPLKYFGLSTKKEENFNNKLWEGEVMHVRELLGVWTVYITTSSFRPYVMVTDANGNEAPVLDAQEAIKKGCSKCKETVKSEDIGKSIVRKKSNGDWRIVCPSCLKVSIQEANAANPTLNLHVQ